MIKSEDIMAGMVNAELTTPLNWREERRRDRLTAAQIGTQARIAEAEASARMRRDKHQARHADRRAARKQRAARRADQAALVRGHVVDLLFVPVIAVPGVLAWTAMADFGSQVFGPAGVILPAFSEGAMWAFAGATTIRLRRDPECPVWYLRAGTVVAACFGAALNFTHGVTPAPGQVRGIGIGVVMALVSVAGVMVHQLVTAGPRRTRAERDAARTRRATTRRERAIRRAARRRAVAELDADGNVRLVHQPATVTLTRHWHGRASLDDAPQSDAVAPRVSLWPRPVPVLGAGAPAQSAPRSAPAATSQAHPEEAHSSAPGQRPGAPASAPKAAPNRRSGRPLKGVTDAAAERHFAADLTAGKVPSERQIKRELHVGQDRAKAIRDHLAERTPRGRVVVPMGRRA